MLEVLQLRYAELWWQPAEMWTFGGQLAILEIDACGSCVDEEGTVTAVPSEGFTMLELL